MDDVDPGHHLAVDAGAADHQTARILRTERGGLFGAVHHRSARDLQVLPRQDQVRPVFQRPAAGEIPQRPPPDKDGRAVGQLADKVITEKYDPIAIYFIVLSSSLYTLFVFPV